MLTRDKNNWVNKLQMKLKFLYAYYLLLADMELGKLQLLTLYVSGALSVHL